MDRRLIYAPQARDDLVSIQRWLTQAGAGRIAARRLGEIKTAINRLKDFPCRWQTGQVPGTRELACTGGYRAIYQLKPDTGFDHDAGDIVVLRVFGPGQDRRVSPIPR